MFIKDAYNFSAGNLPGFTGVRADLSGTHHYNTPFNTPKSSNIWIDSDSYFYRPERAAETDTLNNAALNHNMLKLWLSQQHGNRVYRHQKMMIENAIAGRSVVSTTPTGSGKSLGFMFPAFHKILNDRTARVLALYPLRALGHDQIGKWTKMAEQLHLSPDIIQHIDGSVPTADRSAKLAKARILLATPDVVHAWLMAELERDEVRQFLAHTHLKIIDELGNYDGVFGTNSLLMLRRIDHIQSMLIEGYDPARHRQYIGASGTYPDPIANFKLLTGVDAVHVGLDDNGAPLYRQHILQGFNDGNFLPGLMADLVDVENHQTIIFADSRVKVENYAEQIREALKDKIKGPIERAVIPYKAGLRASDYDQMHGLINSKEARVVVSTSALEAGIDVDFTVGILMNMPPTKAQLLQRIGRVGRREDSTIIIAIPDRSNVLGYKSLYDYMETSPLDAPTLYPTNTSLQLAAAFCLRDEIAKVRRSQPNVQKPRGVQFPRGFNISLERTADPYSSFEPHERPIIPRINSKHYRPQTELPLRSMPSERFALVETFVGGNTRILGNVPAETALREYAPGAIIRHMGRRYRVNRWQQAEGRNSDIILTNYKGPNNTRLLLYQAITANLSENKIIKGAFLTPFFNNPIQAGFLSHMRLRTTLTATSFIEYSKKDGQYETLHPYRYYDSHELENVRRMADDGIDYGPKRHIEYESFGVVLHIPETWFGAQTREFLGEKIAKAYCERNHISPVDIHVEAKRATIYLGEGAKINDHLLVIYERGGNQIGLLERLPGQLRQLLMSVMEELQEQELKHHGVEAVNIGRVNNLLRFTASLISKKPNEIKELVDEGLNKDIELPDGYIPVHEPYALAQYSRTKSVSETVRILAPGLNPVDGKPGYWVQNFNRKQYYKRSARWVTVRKSDISALAEGHNLVASEDTAPVKELETGVVTRFISAARITTEVKQPRLAMDIKTGDLFNVSEKQDQVSLEPYKITDEVVVSLLERASQYKAANLITPES